MKVSLIYPHISKRERYGSKIGESGGTQQPLGIAYLGAYLREQQIPVQLIDAEHEGLSHEEILDRCRAFGTEIYGISTTTPVFGKAVALAQYLKQATPDLPLVVGGPHVSGSPQQTMAEPCFDIGVFGEGEVTLHELVVALEKGRELDEVKGILFRRDGEVVQTPMRPYIGDLDTLPLPARDLLPELAGYRPPALNYKKTPCTNIISTRGCPYKCTFCDHNTFGRKYRMRSAANIVAEIEHLIREYGVQELAFVDDTFNVNDKRLNELFALMKARGIDLPWTCMARINTTSREQLEAMKAAGCWHISFGIESGNQGIVDLIKKGIDLEMVRQVITWCKEIGLCSKGFFMIGHPGETVGTIEETIEFALSIPLTDVVVTINTPLPGSWNYENVSKYGEMATVDWSKHNMWVPVFVPTGLTKEYLEEKHAEFIRRFYFRPSVVVEHLKQLRGGSGLGRFMSMAKSAKALLLRD